MFSNFFKDSDSDKDKKKVDLISVIEIATTKNSTLSVVLLNGEFQCFGLEDGDRGVENNPNNKIHSETRIPRGRYKIGVRTVGGFHSNYSKKSSLTKGMHKGMLQVLDVPNFEYILIHIGNYIKDTAGCLLLGRGATTPNPDSNGDNITISSSTTAYNDLYAKVIDSALAGTLEIEYIGTVTKK